MIFVWAINGVIIALLTSRAFNNSKERLIRSLVYSVVISVVSGIGYSFFFNDISIKDMFLKFDSDLIIYNAWLLLTFIFTIWVFRWKGIR